MKGKKLLSIVLIVAGIVMLGFSYYIKGEVAKGQGQVDSAQSSVDKSQSLFGLNPVTKDVGKGLTSGIQQKINEGQADIAYYTTVSNVLMIAGIVCVVVGAGIFFVGRKRQ